MNREELERFKREGRKVLYTDYVGREVRGSIVEVESNWKRPDGKTCATLHDGRIFEPGGYDEIPWDDIRPAPADIIRLRVTYDLMIDVDEYRLENPDMPRRPLMGPDYEKAIRDDIYAHLGDLTGDSETYRSDVISASNVRVDQLYGRG